MAVAGKGVKEKGADGRFDSRSTCPINTASTGEKMVVMGYVHSDVSTMLLGSMSSFPWPCPASETRHVFVLLAHSEVGSSVRR
jgi:hypothetical protein